MLGAGFSPRGAGGGLSCGSCESAGAAASTAATIPPIKKPRTCEEHGFMVVLLLLVTRAS
jgi:hypothetical protein